VWRILLAVTLAAATSGTTRGVFRSEVSSPDGRLTLSIAQTPDGNLEWSVTAGRTRVIEASALGLLVDGQNLAHGASFRVPAGYRVDDSYPWRGGQSEIKYRSNGARIAATHEATKTAFTIDVQVSNNGAGVRFIVPGNGPRVPDAAMAFRIPAGTIVWSHGLRDHYEAVYDKTPVEQVAAGGAAGHLQAAGRRRLRRHSRIQPA
jgi:alpha-glucosidase